MPYKVSKDGDLQAATGRPAAPGGRQPLTSPPGTAKAGDVQDGPGPGYRLTRHDFSIETRLFTLGLSWRRVEMPAPPAPSPARPRPPAPPPDFEEVLRRLKLYALLEPPPPPEAARGAKVSPAGPPGEIRKITN